MFVQNEEANKKLQETEKKGKSLAETFGEGIKTVAKWGAAITAGATAAVTGLFALTNKTAEYADEIDKLSERTGINREELQRWKYAAGQSGADIGKLEVGIKTLSGVMDDAIRGNEKAIQKFAELGITLEDLQEKSQEDIFGTVMNALADMEQGAVRNALGADLLGKSYTELLPLLNAGSDGMQELKDRADMLGIVMSEESVKANVKFGDTLADVKSAIGGITRGLTDQFLPSFQNAADWLIEKSPIIQEIAGKAFDFIGQAIGWVYDKINDYVIPAFKRLYEWIEPYIPKIKDFLVDAFDRAKYALDKVKETLNALYEWIEPYLPDMRDIAVDAFDKIREGVEWFINAIRDATKYVQEHWDVFEPILTGIAGGVAAFAAIKAAIAIYNGIVGIATTVTGAFGAVLSFITSPIGVVTLAIGALIAIGVALYQNWDVVSTWLKETWDKISEWAQNFAKGFTEVFEKMKEKIVGIWEGFVDKIKSAINWLIEGINGFIRGINSIKIPDWVPGVGGKGINISEIPTLAEGGEILRSGRVIVGEAGPELLELPQGAKVKPLDRVGEGIDYDRLEAIAYTSFFEAFVDAMKSLGKGEIRIDIDGRTLAREMIPRIIAENQRMGVATT